MKIKNKEQGFTTIDLTIAMIIMVIFVSIMTSMIYSVYISSTEARRTATALNYGVDIFEQIGTEVYSNITPASILNNMDNLTVENVKEQTEDNKQIATGNIGTYNVELEMTKPYVDGKIKYFKLTITYAVSAKKTETMELERIRTNKT